MKSAKGIFSISILLEITLTNPLIFNISFSIFLSNSFFSSSNKLELKAKKNKNHELLIRLFRSTQETFKTAESNLTNLTSTLDAVSPLSVLGRGYSIITKDNSKEIIKSDQQVKKGEIISARLKKGYLKAKILRRNSDEK